MDVDQIKWFTIGISVFLRKFCLFLPNSKVRRSYKCLRTADVVHTDHIIGSEIISETGTDSISHPSPLPHRRRATP